MKFIKIEKAQDVAELTPEEIDQINERVTATGSLCEDCVHRNPDFVTCKAFPEGIPYGFVAGVLLHYLPYEGDNGVQFERK